MNNPLEILRTLDRYLSSPAELTVFGRSALALGFSDPAHEYETTHDVDGIIPASTGEPNVDFWLAQQSTNAELKNRGLYITHLFSEFDVILQPDWYRQRLPLQVPCLRLSVYRPATADLILTKMARGDEQDLQDIQFLLFKEPLSEQALQQAFSRARVPAVPEIRELFLAAQPKVLKLAAETLPGR